MVYQPSDEISIQSAIIDYLYRKKHFFVRLNNIPPVSKVGGKMVFRRMPKGSMNGLPDIMVITEGGFIVFLEVKDKGKLSEEQIKFQALCKEKGAEYHVVRKIQDVIDIGL
jgi:hypothetical protein